MPRVSPSLHDADTLRLDALQALAGAALVLDKELRIVEVTEAAEQMLGAGVPIGALAPKILCGAGSKRPVAEALAEGRAIQTVIPHPGTTSERRVSIRTVPIGPVRARRGWVLLLEELPESGQAGVVELQGMWTQDAGMKDMFRIVKRVAASEATVLVRGETGAGKELVAHALHALSPRKDGPFYAINCAALPASLLESELFGHARGSFTGAVSDAVGHVQKAHGGTLFLDEVAELPLEVQAKLLRVLESRTVLPVGGRKPIPVDVRFVSATHRALRKEVEAGRFRGDLMYRLRVIPIFLPSLRARPGDVRLLVQVLMGEARKRGETRLEQVSPEALRLLERHDWPGNVRELKNVLAYAFALSDGPVLLPTDLPPELATSGRLELGPEPPKEIRRSADPEADRILRALDRSSGSRERAAKILGMSRVTLWRRMRALGLAPQPGQP
ncbi:MAG: sigma 54-interacting transcriptional regulator [Polyangiaceae bacterium]|nr:sigma 54-interacting transcriptional regulator [Polyangiaceae bacterium]MBK8939760.1 sigma 54-interacting transcriptional regulator [Polyangiaceae bacterium]